MRPHRWLRLCITFTADLLTFAIRLGFEDHSLSIRTSPYRQCFFLTLSAEAEVQYKTAGYWSKECERSLAWNDPAIGLDWPLGELPDPHQPLLAPKDAEAPGLEALAAAGDLFAPDNV